MSFTEGLKRVSKNLKINDETAERLKKTFNGLFSAVDILKQTFGFLFRIVKEVFSVFAGPATNGVTNIAAKIGDFLTKLRDTIAASGFFEKSVR